MSLFNFPQNYVGFFFTSALFYKIRANLNGMVVFAGIAVLCLGALIVRYLREKKCHSECPPCPSGPSPDMLKISVSYCPGLNDVGGSYISQISQISQNVIQELHNTFVGNCVSYTKNARKRI